MVEATELMMASRSPSMEWCPCWIL